MAVACSLDQGKIDVFQLADLKTVNVEAMIPGTITTKAGMAQKVEFATDFGALLKTKNNEKLEVELTIDLTQMIKFKIGNEAKCK